MRILTVLGARPQFIKAAVVSRAITDYADMTEIMVHTGQHFDFGMSDIFFEELQIPRPTHHLGISGGSHGEMTGAMLAGVEQVILRERPDWVLVYGDTNSTLAGALAAAKLHIPVAHVEAGLRSFNRRMPEEINRILTDHCADLLLTPTDMATQHLRREGMPAGRIVQVGDVMYDAALHFGELALISGRGAQAFALEPGGYVLATVHRQENTDDPFRLAAIVGALAEVAEELPVILPLHPRTRQRMMQHGLDQMLGKVRLVDPLGYLDMVGLQRDAAVIATDSGGVQKEAFFQGVPCVTLRDETEWMELVEAGWNRLAPPADAHGLANVILSARGWRGAAVTPYGDGRASQAIVQALAGRG